MHISIFIYIDIYLGRSEDAVQLRLQFRRIGLDQNRTVVHARAQGGLKSSKKERVTSSNRRTRRRRTRRRR